MRRKPAAGPGLGHRDDRGRGGVHGGGSGAGLGRRAARGTGQREDGGEELHGAAPEGGSSPVTGSGSRDESAHWGSLELAPKYWPATRARLDSAQLNVEFGPISVPPPLLIRSDVCHSRPED